jgi:hypothetical protein
MLEVGSSMISIFGLIESTAARATHNNLRDEVLLNVLIFMMRTPQ